VGAEGNHFLIAPVLLIVEQHFSFLPILKSCQFLSFGKKNCHLILSAKKNCQNARDGQKDKMKLANKSGF